MTRYLHPAYRFLLSLAASCCLCHASEVVFVRSPTGSPTEQQQLQIAAQFYGQGLTVITAGANGNDPALRKTIERKTTLAVVIAANALPAVSHQELLRSLLREPGPSVPLLILGVTPEVDATILRTWSGDAALACKRVEGPLRTKYVIRGAENFTRQLAGLAIPFTGANAFYFVLGGRAGTQQIVELRDDHQALPMFIEADFGQSRIFLSTVPLPSDAGPGANPESDVNAFAGLAPAMMFIRFCAGERGWHALHHYANLTIDDAWLREPYGYVDYQGLLAQMEEHNFHSTIAFVPWNYDRSDREVASLIRSHPERFSICVHGDNHDHKEFTDFQSVPLVVQTAALRQSLARMDRFQALTGIPYDKVMVFPHSIGPEKTLAALKNYNYLATINSSNVPMDAVRPSDLSFALRAATLSFAGFPSIRRYGVQGPIPAGLLAVNAFLDNPLLFYCHQLYFAPGIGAFSAEADQVNKIQPDTRWRGLGEIVRHLYLVKLRDDDNYDVLSFAGNISLENPSLRDSLFYVRKEETDRPAAVTVDGQSWPYSFQDGYLEMRVPVASGKTRAVTIIYGNTVESPAIGIEKDSFRVYCLRMASDFRDITLAKYAPGRVLISRYYEHGAPLTLVLLCALAIGVSCIFVAWRLRVMIKGRAAV